MSANHGFHSYQEAFDFAYGKPEVRAQLAVEHKPEAFATSEPETVTTPEPEIATIPELVTITTSKPETATAPESAIVMALEPETALTPEPETLPQSRTVLDAEPGHQEQPPAKKARHSEGQATETFSDTQENTFGSNDIVDQAGESSSSASDPSEIVYSDIVQAKERLSALMEGGGAVKIIPVSPKRKWEE
ncbi:Cauli-VI domain-containing protein [Fusarium keratoplasticum]|uniref:Cauli-VI domain-containing protein n=1 Tax=Fusarium keratoplasticum TaxID=1328300 RepID=A0ACC0QLX2_9HYPO|nr:Cauli-VI domain-containing protein [Fusarium keratoplasticum]KAI8658032.1 Cauli-VI domain-containing protein [Fusarium keratoplasticum]KAI8658990.1 Cauli-VI domain-containing protein [Fusarium keratoplasticum]